MNAAEEDTVRQHVNKVRQVASSEFKLAALFMIEKAYRLPDENRLNFIKQCVACYDGDIAMVWSPDDALLPPDLGTDNVDAVENQRTELASILYDNLNPWDKGTLEVFDGNVAARRLWRSFLFLLRFKIALENMTPQMGQNQNDAIVADRQNTLADVDRILHAVYAHGYQNSSWLGKTCANIFVNIPETSPNSQSFFKRFIWSRLPGKEAALKAPLQANRMTSAAMHQFLYETCKPGLTFVETLLLSAVALSRHVAFVTLPQLIAKSLMNETTQAGAFALRAVAKQAQNVETREQALKMAKSYQSLFSSVRMEKLADCLSSMQETPLVYGENSTFEPSGPSAPNQVDGLEGIPLDVIQRPEELAIGTEIDNGVEIMVFRGLEASALEEITLEDSSTVTQKIDVGISNLPLGAQVITSLAYCEMEYNRKLWNKSVKDAKEIAKSQSKSAEARAENEERLALLLMKVGNGNDNGNINEIDKNAEDMMHDLLPRHEFLYRAAVKARDAGKKKLDDYIPHAFPKVSALRLGADAKATTKRFFETRGQQDIDQVKQFVKTLRKFASSKKWTKTQGEVLSNLLVVDLDVFKGQVQGIELLLGNPCLYDVTNTLLTIVGSTSWMTREYMPLIKSVGSGKDYGIEKAYEIRCLATLLAPLLYTLNMTSYIYQAWEKGERVNSAMISLSKCLSMFKTPCTYLNRLARAKKVDLKKFDPVESGYLEKPLGYKEKKKKSKSVAESEPPAEISTAEQYCQTISEAVSSKYKDVRRAFDLSTDEDAVKSLEEIQELGVKLQVQDKVLLQEYKNRDSNEIVRLMKALYKEEIEPYANWKNAWRAAGAVLGFYVSSQIKFKAPFATGGESLMDPVQGGSTLQPAPLTFEEMTPLLGMSVFTLESMNTNIDSGLSGGGGTAALCLNQLAYQPALSDQYIYQSSYSHFGQAVSDAAKAAVFYSQFSVYPPALVAVTASTFALSYYFRRGPNTAFRRSWVSFGAASFAWFNAIKSMFEAIIRYKEKAKAYNTKESNDEKYAASGTKSRTDSSSLAQLVQNVGSKLDITSKFIQTHIGGVFGGLANFLEFALTSVGFVLQSPVFAFGAVITIWGLRKALKGIIEVIVESNQRRKDREARLKEAETQGRYRLVLQEQIQNKDKQTPSTVLLDRLWPKDAPANEDDSWFMSAAKRRKVQETVMEGVPYALEGLMTYVPYAVYYGLYRLGGY